MPKNLNTVKFWNKQFKAEYNYMKKGGEPGKDSMFRWEIDRMELMAELIPVKGTVLDVSCGMGSFTRFLKARLPFVEVSGFDFSDFAIEKAKEIDSRIDYKVGDVYDMPYKDNSFQTLTAGEILEHLEHPNKFLKECKRVLKKNGRIIITTPIFEGELKSEEHIKEYTGQELLDLVKKHFAPGEMKVSDVRVDPIKKTAQKLAWQLIWGMKE